MSDSDHPLRRAIGWSGAIRWLIALAATLAIGAAFYDGRDALGGAGLVFLALAVGLAIRARRARSDADGNL